MALLPRALDARDLWRSMEDHAKVAGNSFCIRACVEAGVGDGYLQLWFQGIILELAEIPPRVALEGSSSVRDQPEFAAAELDPVAAMWEITGYPGGCRPPDHRVCLSQPIAKPDKVRAAHDRSNPAYGPNEMLVNPPAEYGDMDGFLGIMSPGAFLAGLGLQDCFLHWLASPACRRLLGVRCPVAHHLAVHLFLPFGWGPSPG